MGLPAPLGVAAYAVPVNSQSTAVLRGQITAVGPTQPCAFRGPLNLAIWASTVTALTTTAGSLTATVTSATGLAAGNAINSSSVPRGTTIGALSSTTVTLAIPMITLTGYVSLAGTLVTGVADTTGLLGATVTVASTAAGVTIPASTTVVEILTASTASTASVNNIPVGVIRLSAAPTATPMMNAPVPLNFARTGNAITVTGADANASFGGYSVTFSATIQIERSFNGCSEWILCNIGGAGAPALFSGTAVTPINLTFGEPEREVYYRFNCTAYASGTINYHVSQIGGASESLAIGPLTGG